MKVLMVDNDPAIGKSFEKLPMDMTEFQALRSGDAALRGVKNALKRRDPFELIAVDIDLPDMDGRKVALEIRKVEQEWSIPKEKRAFIMMVTARADEKSVKTSLAAGCNAFIVKPFKPETIVKILAKSRLKSKLSGDAQKVQKTVDPVEIILNRLESGKLQIASLPDVSVKLNEMAKKGLSFKLIGDLIRKDPAITAKIMTVANSAYYGSASKVKTVNDAISRIGLHSTKQYVDAICNRQLFVTKGEKYMKYAEALWQHSLYCAIASHNVVTLLDLNLKEDAFSLGMLHDIGKIFLLQMTSELEAKSQLNGKFEMQKLYGSIEKYHTTIAARALRKWKFSKEYIEGALFHENLAKKVSPSQQLLVLHFANILAKTMMPEKGSETDMDLGTLGTLESSQLLKITPDMIEKIKEKTEAQLPLFN
jgi:HD-like signal output (HDOD) protein